MTKIDDSRAILAVDPAPFGVAYVFFERGELRDWGRHFGAVSDDVLIAMLKHLIDHFGADVLVLEDPAALRNERRPRMRHVLRRFASAAQQDNVEVIAVARHAVRMFWRQTRGLLRKHEVAAAIVDNFPELQALALKPRKAWRSEDSRAGVFDALTLVLFAFPPAPVSR